MQIHIERIGDVAVLECEGRLVRSEAAFMLRDAVMAQGSARVVVLDFSNLSAVEGGGLGMLVFLHDWACDHGIHLKLFNPRDVVSDRLCRANSISDFEIASIDELTALISHENRHGLAA